MWLRKIESVFTVDLGTKIFEVALVDVWDDGRVHFLEEVGLPVSASKPRVAHNLIDCLEPHHWVLL